VTAGLGVVAVALAATMTGVGAAEDARRLAVSGRPLAALRMACITAVAALVLQEQMGTAILDPAAAWAMLVVVGVSMGDRKRPAEVGPVGVVLAAPVKVVLVAAAMGAAFLYMTRVVMPVGREIAMLDRAARLGDSAASDEMLRAAADANPLAWEPAMIRASLWRGEASGAGGATEAAMDLEKATDAFRDALARQPRLIEAERGMAECRLALPGAAEDKAALAEALTHWDAAQRLYPTGVPIMYMRAQILDRMGDGPVALEAYEAALGLDDQLPAPSRRLTSAMREQVAARVQAIRESVAAGGKAP
jgi:hypothetical protein